MAPGLSEQRELVDGHTHLWERASNPQDWIDPRSMAAINRDFLPADLGDALARATRPDATIESAVVVQSSNSAAETLEILAKSSDGNISAVVGWVDLAAPDIGERLDAVRTGPHGELLAGIRHTVHIEADSNWLLRRDVGNGLHALSDAGLTFDLVVRPEQLPLATRVVQDHPELTFVLDHLGKPPIASGSLEDWRRDLHSIAAFPNVVAKLSGLTIEADWLTWSANDVNRVLDDALAAFGPGRLIFGSDWPLIQLTGGYSSWLDCYLAWSATLSPHERAAMDAGTARDIYKIAAPHSLGRSS